MAQLPDGQPAEMGCRLAGGEIIECRGRRRSWRRTCDLLVGAGDAMGMTAGVRLRLHFTYRGMRRRRAGLDRIEAEGAKDA